MFAVGAVVVVANGIVCLLALRSADSIPAVADARHKYCLLVRLVRRPIRGPSSGSYTHARGHPPGRLPYLVGRGRISVQLQGVIMAAASAERSADGRGLGRSFLA